MDLRDGFFFDEPDLLVPWGITRRELERRFFEGASPTATAQLQGYALAFSGVPVTVQFVFCKNERLYEIVLRRRLAPCRWRERLCDTFGETDDRFENEWRWSRPGATVVLGRDETSEGRADFELVRVEATRRLGHRVYRMVSSPHVQ